MPVLLIADIRGIIVVSTSASDAEDLGSILCHGVFLCVNWDGDLFSCMGRGTLWWGTWRGMLWHVMDGDVLVRQVVAGGQVLEWHVVVGHVVVRHAVVRHVLAGHVWEGHVVADNTLAGHVWAGHIVVGQILGGCSEASSLRHVQNRSQGARTSDFQVNDLTL